MFELFLNDRYFDTLYFDKNMDAESVKKSVASQFFGKKISVKMVRN